MSTFSGQDIVAQERCKIVYATFVDYIVRCFDSVKRECYIYNPGWWNTTWDPVNKVLLNDQFELRGVDFTGLDINLPLIQGVIAKDTTGISVKLKAEEYSKWRVYPVVNLPICALDQSWLYGLIPYNLFCNQYIKGNNFYLLRSVPIISNLRKVGNELLFTLAPVTNFIDPEESLTEPMDIKMSLIGLDNEPIESFSIVTIDSIQYVQISEPVKYMEIVETSLYSDSLEGSKFYLFTCADNISNLGISCISPVTFYDQLTSTTITKTSITLTNVDTLGQQKFIPTYVGNRLDLGDISLKFLNYNTNWEEITENYLKIIPGDANKMVLLVPNCDLILLKDSKGNVHIIDMSTNTYSCLYGTLTLTTLCDTYDNILKLYKDVRYPVYYAPNSLVYPTIQNNLNACLMIRAENDSYYIDGDFLPLYWKKDLNKFTADTKLFFPYKLINQVLVYSDSSIKLQGLDYDRFGTRPYEVEFKYFKWNTTDKEFVSGPASEAQFDFSNYYLTINLSTNICKVKYEVWVNGIYDRTISSMLISMPDCDFPRQYDIDLCACKPYYCVDMGDTMLMPCEILSKETTGEALPFCMGWPGETKVPFKDVVRSTCPEPQVCTIYGCLPPTEFITPCTGTLTGITEFPACDWFGPGSGMQFSAPIMDYYLDADGTIWCEASVLVNMGNTQKYPDWVIGNIYDYLTPNEYTDIDGNSYVVDPMYYIYLKYFASELNDPLNPLSGSKISWPFISVKMTLGKLSQILPGIEAVKWDWSKLTDIPMGSWVAHMQPCKWMTISVAHTRDHSYVTYNFKGGVRNVHMVTDFNPTGLQTGYDAYCDKVKWLVNEDAYAYAVYMGYLDPAVGITV